MKRIIGRLAVLTAALMLLSGDVRAEGTQKAGTSVQIMVYGNKNNVEFQVRGEDGTSIKGASIDIRNGKAEWLFYGTTDSDGRKQLWMPLATQSYRVYKAGYETAQGSFTVRNLLSRVVVKVTLKKTKTPAPEPKPEPEPDPTPNPSPSPGPAPKPDGGTGDKGGSSSSPGGSTGGGSSTNGSSSEGSSAGNTSHGSDGETDKENNKENNNKENSGLDKEKGTADGNRNREEDREGNGESTAEADSQYLGRVDLAVNVYKTDGTPASGAKVELHSRIWSGTLDDNGFILFCGVEIGPHELYVKNRFGKTLAKKAFTIERSNITNIESDSVLTVGVAVTEITVNIEYSEDGSGEGKMSFVSAWEGLTDQAGNQVSVETANQAAQIERNLGLRFVGDVRFWLVVLLWFLLFLSGYYIGKRRERHLIEREIEEWREADKTEEQRAVRRDDADRDDI